MSDKNIEIRLSGEGGQGLILAGVILAESAIIEGKNASQSQYYGPESRGGISKSEVIISEGEIVYPEVAEPDMVLVLSQVACIPYTKDIRSDETYVLFDSDKVSDFPSLKKGKIYKLPFTKTAYDKLGKPFIANIIALGTVVALTNAVKRESIEKAVLARVPKGTEELNRAALNEGFELAKTIKL
ncbi:MAG: 2-oxoacid:acceptor oxidoreductase family protein [Deltaproteobacteria bacterium]|nr:2-oxoacid:acceptor oxidoreductase family protein [Deltaproteobacteria bacterium]MCL5792486.1 2-oxoacid:acceptor oxidoreductase family protein [Deltaproteobacteria bacterium]